LPTRAQVLRLTGATPTLALHVLWDLPNGLEDAERVKTLEGKTGIRAGSINPNLFQDQEYKFGSLCNPSKEIRGRRRSAHMLDSIAIAKAEFAGTFRSGCRMGRIIPGTQSIRKRIGVAG
jgi:L-rhamnose isomerase/sugar isomerase